eukprot:NODE_177_length_1883_cov_282.990700.p1 GENE.NODE_177_length_1883_cov_282.990700~~NODE_177_length_1883_cov_282.990700.p1  ORF type:complete len:462 (+),score=137.80 NODE_177_length_1883_cov_282.990700:186-1571(+)
MMVTPDGKQITTKGVEVGPNRWAITSTQVASLLQDHLALFTDPDVSARVFLQNHVKKSCSRGQGIALTKNNDDPEEVKLMVSHSWDGPMGKFLRDVLIMTSDKEHLGMFACLLSLYHGTQEELNVQLTQGSGEIEQGCFSEVLRSVKEAGGAMIVVSNEKVLDAGLYSRLWCSWEVYCAVRDGVAIVVHPLTGTTAHLFGTGGKERFRPELGRCGSPALAATEDEDRIRHAIANGAGWDVIRKSVLMASQYTTEVGRIDVDGRGRIGPKGIELLLQAVAADSIPASTLDLMANRIGCSGAAALATALQQNETIATLKLSSNNIGDLGAHALAAALQQNARITVLDLSRNNIGDLGAQALAIALQQNETLATLNLNGNCIGHMGAQALAAALQQNEMIAVLNLRSNNIGDLGAQALAAALRQNETLATLHLSGNDIGSVGAQALRDVAAEKKDKGVDFELKL